jgi:predicted membrane-bound spermidine synthase
MEMIEDIVWIMTGLISTLVTMEVAWRMAMKKTKTEKMTSGSKPMAMEDYNGYIRNDISKNSRYQLIR